MQHSIVQVYYSSQQKQKAWRSLGLYHAQTQGEALCKVHWHGEYFTDVQRHSSMGEYKKIACAFWKWHRCFWVAKLCFAPHFNTAPNPKLPVSLVRKCRPPLWPDKWNIPPELDRPQCQLRQLVSDRRLKTSASTCWPRTEYLRHHWPFFLAILLTGAFAVPTSHPVLGTTWKINQISPHTTCCCIQRLQHCSAVAQIPIPYKWHLAIHHIFNLFLFTMLRSK